MSITKEAAPRRYVLHPGRVESRSDGQIHYIGIRQLASLYRVRMCDCVVYPTGDDEFAQSQRVSWRSRPGDIDLYPKYSGDYRLPEPI